MSTYSSGHTIIANGNPVFWGTNGPAVGSERSLVLEQTDPKQATYINFSAPYAVDSNGVPLMEAPQDFQIGIGGYLYGKNTLNRLGLGVDSIWAINWPVNMIFTTTVDAYPYGARSFLSYDNQNAVWHFDADVPGNGTYKNAGHQDAMTLDTRSRDLTVGGNLAVGRRCDFTSFPVRDWLLAVKITFKAGFDSSHGVLFSCVNLHHGLCF